jgi:hypothetical protein
MKFNKWTVGLAAVGLVSLNSAVQADEAAAPAPATVLTALSSTTLSGYVDTSAQWNLGTGNQNSPPYFTGGASKADGFNLNVVDLALDKPLDESQWSAGYHVELWLGPDANSLGTQSVFGTRSFASTGDFAVRQAYIALRTPICNGIDWKIGVWDTIIGYESLTSYNNPNYTHSYGFTIEPTTHTGIQATYKVSDLINVTAGIANTIGPAINEKGQQPNQSAQSTAESYKTYMAAIGLTAPSSWGWIGGSTFSAGVINGFNSNVAPAEGVVGGNQTSFYAGTTVNTPLSCLKLGASLDFLTIHDASDIDGDLNGDTWDGALYLSYQATEKLSLNLRGEFLDDASDTFMDTSDTTGREKIWSATATAQYDLWKNVVSRVEFRWDHGDNGNYFGGTSVGSAPNRRNAYLLAAQFIYKF